MKENRRELNLEVMEKVNGGLPLGYVYSHDEEKNEAQLADFRKRKEEAQNLADIRMRAAEDALRAAMRIDAQEQAIKAEMAANRIYLD